MGKVCVWYLYRKGLEEELYNISASIMRKYSWVGNIVSVDTTNDYGVGWDKSPANGGFNEIRARNDAMRLAYETGCEWLLQCDADEVYLDSFGEEIIKAENNNANIIGTQCYDFYHECKYYERRIKNYFRRCIHRELYEDGLRWRTCGNPNPKNNTMHCELGRSKEKSPFICKAAFYSAHGMHLLHVHDMFNKKIPGRNRNKKIIFDREKPLKTSPLPKEYIVFWKEYNGIK